MSNILQTRLVALVKDAGESGLDRLQAALAGGATTFDPESDLPGNLLVPVLRAWQAVGLEAIPPGALALALGAVRQMKRETAEAAPSLDLVWTGPHSPSNIQALSTLAVLREMIEKAKTKVLVVGYNLTRTNPYSISVVDSLAKAMTNGARVVMAMHEDGSNFDYVKAMWPQNLDLPRLLRWVGLAEDSQASLHAKVIVVDSTDLLITSANLTYHGLEQNIEMGVRIRDKRFAAEVDRHFSNLERERILVPFEGASR